MASTTRRMSTFRSRPSAIDDWLPADPAVRPAVLVKLVHVELEYRLQRGESVRVETYLSRFPELAGDATTVLELIAWEYRLRHRRERDLTSAEYLRRFPQHGRELSHRLSDVTGPLPTEREPTRPNPSSDGPPAAARAGTVIVGTYKLLEEIGAGGMGSVWTAHDAQLGRVVALKTIKPDIAAQPGVRDRFLREARAAAQIEHDNVIPVWQVGEDAGILFIVMPLLQGESLDGRLRRERVARVGVILKVGREVADGLAAAHTRGLVHRDVKPANVWLEGNPTGADPAARFRRCKLLDFGLARPACGT